MSFLAPLTVTWIASHSCHHCDEFSLEWDEIRRENPGYEYRKIFLEEHPSYVRRHDVDEVPMFLFSRDEVYYEDRVKGGYKDRIVAVMRSLQW